MRADTAPDQLSDRHRRPGTRAALPMPPKMLFTKPLTALLHANHTPQIHTLLLVTPAGKLLSHSSPLPAYLLRSQATLASSIWSAYAPLSVSNGGADSSTIAASLPLYDQTRDDDDDDDDDDDLAPRVPAASHHRSSSATTTTPPQQELASIMLQLDFGTVVIRQLKCSLLFVAIGPTTVAAPTHSAPGIATTSTSGLAHKLDQLAVSPRRPHLQPPSHASATPSPPAIATSSSHDSAAAGAVPADGAQLLSIKRELDVPSRATSDAGSVATSRGVGAATLRRMRRQAEELASWLDGELAGFVLAPEGR